MRSAITAPYELWYPFALESRVMRIYRLPRMSK
jgi:hypothetical protein